MGDFGTLGKLPSVEDVQERCNKAFDALFHYDSSGVRHPYVCTFCDEFIMCAQEKNFYPLADLKKKRALFEWSNYLDGAELATIQHLVNAFKFQDRDNKVDDPSWLSGLCLSGRGVIGKKSNSAGSRLGFSCCNACKHAIQNNYTPFNAIINKNYVGHAPDCLTSLTELELAFITPVKGYGYCFHWVGGQQKKLVGSMTFMRVEKRSIAKASAQLEGMGLHNHIVTVLSGPMTAKQRSRAKTQIRTDKIIEAVKWLCENHVRWREVNYDRYRQELENCVPTVIDHSNEVSTENENLESEELFSCYYPDGAVNGRQGGFNNTGDFKEYINDMKTRGFDVQLQIELQKEFIDGRDGDQLISSCLLQFPFGIGGIKETRVLRDGSSCEEAKLEPFLAHLTRLSQPIFQLPMFQLIVYSLTSKLRLLRKSRLQLRSERTVDALVKGLTSHDVRNTARARQAGDRSGGTVGGRALLDGVDGMSRALPHSNEAAQKARSTGESMQHVFGMPSIFLTVTFDDENSVLMQVLAAEEIDDDRPVTTIPDAELAVRATQRKELRLNYPGLGSMNFEILYQIVVEQVVGWDIRQDRAMDHAGLFGTCEALAAAMEEQGRLTVHSHMSIWVKGFAKLRHDLFFGSRDKRRLASKLIPNYFEHISCTALIGSAAKRELLKAFDHECKVSIHERLEPDVIDDQGLRDLRHRMAYRVDNTYATCRSCGKLYTYEDLVGLYCQEIGGIDSGTPAGTSVSGEVGISKCRMHALCIEYQKEKQADLTPIRSLAINAAYNAHASSHVSGCFKCQKKKNRKKHTCGSNSDCECRFRLPDRPRPYATVRFVKDCNPWFEWNGDEKDQPLIEVLPKRQRYDCFQNVSCGAISESKFTCNTNVSVITDGPIGMYQFKYIMKPTQEDDTAAYALVEKSIKSLESRVHEDDKKEAARIICRAAFAHNKRNVIGPSFASYLTRHDSRFYFSHKFVYCPLKDIEKCLEGGSVPAIVKYAGDVPYLENQALHYLCRPKHLEGLSLREFFEEYYVIDFLKEKKLKKGEPDLRFINDTGSFQHPSARLKKGNPPTLLACRSGVAEREALAYVKVSQYTFPDTARFKANILSCPNDQISQAMETYAKYMLLLFYPYRKQKDLEPAQPWTRYPYVMKLREVNASDHQREALGFEKVLFKDRNLEFLQNIQNCARNSVRYNLSCDDLQSVTKCYHVQGDYLDPIEEDDDENLEEEDDDELPYESFLDYLEQIDDNDHDSTKFVHYIQGYSLKSLRNLGFNKCGFNKSIPTVHVPGQDGADARPWIIPDSGNASATPTAPTASGIPQWKVRDIMRVLLRKRTTKARANVFKRNPTAQVGEANGSLESIQEWAAAAKLDRRQKRSFEAIVAAFILTFHDFEQSDYNDNDLTSALRRRARAAKACLTFLTGTKDGRIIMLMHGPGGSGKSTVISLVLAYAKEFCELLGHPFTIRTIVVTALSGVAATLIHGETTHKAMGTEKKNGPDEEEIEAWADTRLVIIDECSFASPTQIEKIEYCARVLKNNAYSYYGGLNIVFAGDFSQLEPPKQQTLYHEGTECPAFHGVLNVFIELDGRHRFKDDPAYGEMMMRFRNGEPTVEDIRTINDNCVISDEHVPPPNVPTAVWRNSARDAIGAAMFEEYCIANQPDDADELFKGAALVLMDNLEMRDGVRTYVRITSNQVKMYFYTHCGEDGCKTANMTTGRVDPVLKLYPGCALMLTENSDVSGGKANGSRVTLESINVKAGEQGMAVKLMCGTVIQVYYASQVRSLTVVHEVEDICPRKFDVEIKSWSFKAKLEVYDEKRTTFMHGDQFPVISNSVTTGHKFQGCTLVMIAIFELYYGQNWIYVILSRVTTMKGLYLAKPLDEDLTKYAMSKHMKNMIESFERRIGLKYPTEDEYKKYLDLDRSIRRSTDN